MYIKNPSALKENDLPHVAPSSGCATKVELSAVQYSLFSELANVASTLWSTPIPTTREVISTWFDEGKKKGATHMIIYTDTFSYGDYPHYVYPGQDPRQVVAELAKQELLRIMEVYSLSLDKEMQLNERRSWHFEVHHSFPI
jgi:hypothetical protein